MRKDSENKKTSGNGSEQINRIKRYEDIFDRASAAVSLYKEASERLDELIPEIAELAAYYEGDEWRRDFADDEAGLIPRDVKRGVLSEDGIYDLLDEIGSLASLDTLKKLNERISDGKKQA